MTSMLLTTRMASAVSACGAAVEARAADMKSPSAGVPLSRLRERVGVRGEYVACPHPVASRLDLSRFTGEVRSRLLGAALGALRPAGVLLGVVLGTGFDEGTHLVLHRFHPSRGLDPLRAVP